VLQDKRYPYLVSTAAARTSLPAARKPALPNSDVIDEARSVNRAKRPMRVSKLSAYRSFDRGWGNKPKGVMCRWAAHVRHLAAYHINARL
jgi:hypothetical protein